MLDRGNEEGFDENGATPFLDQYEYDSNGNLTTDPYKKLIISYNHLNLPDTILQTGTANRIVWRYDAAGNKLLKEVYNDSIFLAGAYTENSYQAGALFTDGQPTALDSTILTARDSIRFLPGFHAKPGFRLTAKIDSTLVPVDQTTYIGSIEYRNNDIQAIYHSEGRATPDSSSWRHEYVISDHLGNTRVRFSDLNGNNSIDSTELLSTHDYFSYGMSWSLGGYKYTYNGKEENLEHGLNSLNFGARIQDPTLGRFTSVDRFAEKYTSLSGYGYAAGNPVKYIDVNGDSIGVNLLNSSSQEAFNAFFGTKEGKAFVSQFAAKGQTVNGYTFKADGKYHTQDIDLVYSDRDFGKGEESTGAETTGGTKGGTFIEGRLKLGVSINTTAEETSLIDRVTAVTHESFLHVQEYSFDYTDNKKLDFSHDPFYNKTKNNSPSSRHHLMFHNKPGAPSTHPLATKGLRVLESVNSRNNLGYSRTQLWNKIWTFWD